MADGYCMPHPKPAHRGRKPRKPLPKVHAGGKRKRTSRRRAQRKARLQDADRLFAEYIKTRDDWQCRNCGSVHVIQCAHIVSRRYRATRWDPDNAVALCAKDHLRWTYDPLGWEAWIDERFPVGRLAGLKAKARAGVAHVDYEEVCATLRAQLVELRLRRGERGER